MMTMMMGQLGPVGTVLSVVFVLFMAVLVLELCYVWWSRHRRPQDAGRGSRALTCMKRGWPKMVGCAGGEAEAEEDKGYKGWAKLLLWWRTPAEQMAVAKMGCSDVMEEGGNSGRQDEEEEEDVLKTVGPWGGPPRLLFTIKEETKEEMELEEVWYKANRASSSVDQQQQVLVSSTSTCSSVAASSCTSPFLTPPSSPPFATPFGSPAPAASLNNAHALRLVVAVEVSDSTSSSTSSSSPLLQGWRPLSVLFEDTSSFSSSSVVSSPAVLSPSSAASGGARPYSSPASCTSPTAKKRGQRHPLCLLLDPPPCPSSALYHYHLNRVHPLTTQSLAKSRPFPAPSLVNSEPPPLPFHIPAPSQPTTPCPFRPSLLAKGGAVSSPLTALQSPRFPTRVA